MDYFDVLFGKYLNKGNGSGGGGNSNLLQINFTLTSVENEYSVTCDTEPNVVFDAYRNNAVIVGRLQFEYYSPMTNFVSVSEYEEDDYYERGYEATFYDQNSGVTIYVQYYEESGHEGAYTVDVEVSLDTLDIYCYWKGEYGTGEWEVPSAGLTICNSLLYGNWDFKNDMGYEVDLSGYSVAESELIGFNLNPFTDIAMSSCEMRGYEIIRLSLANSRGSTLMCDDSAWLVKIRIKYRYYGGGGGHN